MGRDLEILLEGIEPFRTLPPQALEALAEALTRRPVAPGEYLFRQGVGPPSHVFYLISASAEIRVGPPEEEHTVSRSRPGQLVGWLTVFTEEPFPASARIVEAGEVLQIPATVLRGLLEQHPSVGSVLAGTMARRLEDLFEEVRTQAERTPLSRADLFPFRRRVSEAITTGAVRLPPGTPVRGAARTMGRERVSSALVTEGATLRGIVTEKDLVQRVLAAGRDAEDTTLEQVMTAPVLSVSPDTYLYKALGIMRRQEVRHLAVVDGDRLLGTVSMRALMAMGTSTTLELAEGIEGASSLATLAEVRQRTVAVCADLLEGGTAGAEVSRLLSHLSRDLHRRVLEIAVAELEAEGRGPPPLPFCFIVMGSHGRGENHLNSDQDHGMILADYPPSEWQRVEPYFMELSERVSRGLARVGFPLCRGQVMSSNPVWRKPVREWKDQVRGWYAEPESVAVRYTTLFYDFLPIWGEVSLARELRQFLTVGIQRNHALLRSLYREASHHRVPLTLFKNFVTERSGPHKGQMDLKRSGILFVVECARILALRYGIPETGTLDRLTALAKREAVPRDEVEFVCTAYRTLLHFLLSTQVRKRRAGDASDNYVDPHSLSIQERYLLRHALEATGRLQGAVHAAFGEIFF